MARDPHVCIPLQSMHEIFVYATNSGVSVLPLLSACRCWQRAWARLHLMLSSHPAALFVVSMTLCTKVSSLLQGWLLDNVYAIREAAIQYLVKLVQVQSVYQALRRKSCCLSIQLFGLGWAKKSVIPKIVQMGADRTYLARLTTLFAIYVRQAQYAFGHISLKIGAPGCSGRGRGDQGSAARDTQIGQGPGAKCALQCRSRTAENCRQSR